MPLATGTVERCEKIADSLEAEAGALLDEFAITLESGRDFHPSIEKIEAQINIAKRKMAANSEMELNEVSVIADKLSSELASVSGMCAGASLYPLQDSWAEEFEAVRGKLDRLMLHIRKMKGAHHSGEGVVESRGALLLFGKDAKACREKLLSLKSVLSRKKGAAFTRVLSAKKRVELLRASVGKSFDAITRKRLRGKIDAAKAEISEFMKRTGSGRIFVDHKHLTITSEHQRMRVPLTQAHRFALESVAPLGKSLSRLGKAVVVGRYGHSEGKWLLRIGERSVVGDSFVYRESTFSLN